MRLSICDDNIVDDNESVRLSSASLMDRKKCYFSCYFSFFLFFLYFYEHGCSINAVKLVHRDGNCVELREI